MPELVLLFLLGSGAAYGKTEDFQFQGFLSQTIAYAPDNPFFTEDTGISYDNRELGLNASWIASDKLRLAGQVLSRQAGSLDDGDPRLDFLLLDYNAFVNETWNTGIRLGRVKSHYGLYNSTRDIPHGRPGVFVPRSVYFESLRSAILSLDGANAYASFSGSRADIHVNAFGGSSHFQNDAIEYQLFQSSAPGKFKDIDGAGLHVVVEPHSLPDLLLAYTYVEFATEYEDAPTFNAAERIEAIVALVQDPGLFAQYVTSMEMEASINLFSAQYTPGDWILSAEYLVIDIQFKDTTILDFPMPQDVFRDQNTTLSYYVQAEWQAVEKLSLYTRYEALYNDKDDKDGSNYAELAGGNPATQFNRALTLGGRWYFTPDFSATAEYSRNNGAAFLNGQSDTSYADLKEDWDLFFLQLSYHF
ncbi:hypothetical protein E4634_05345 [Mangrovimicrobium sediminis]|uniref:Uncharacterized protein n=1 Tax=Mangrovimicrobium sediminis TaxID=2562682 RepID=A0A4Z0M5D3_9GAMM|nr:hypothetical protein [Haliea sp. SAOS-164]TGD74627.1 hypothetical protein E4634_05345 [Haliea sp. SAOS-164]